MQENRPDRADLDVADPDVTPSLTGTPIADSGR
jgi:hypothetical protein